jgi:hypothetical protein
MFSSTENNQMYTSNVELHDPNNELKVNSFKNIYTLKIFKNILLI